jgi:hypothetical protein
MTIDPVSVGMKFAPGAIKALAKALGPTELGRLLRLLDAGVRKSSAIGPGKHDMVCSCRLTSALPVERHQDDSGIESPRHEVILGTAQWGWARDSSTARARTGRRHVQSGGPSTGRARWIADRLWPPS